MDKRTNDVTIMFFSILIIGVLGPPIIVLFFDRLLAFSQSRVLLHTFLIFSAFAGSWFTHFLAKAPPLPFTILFAAWWPFIAIVHGEHLPVAFSLASGILMAGLAYRHTHKVALKATLPPLSRLLKGLAIIFILALIFGYFRFYEAVLEWKKVNPSHGVGSALPSDLWVATLSRIGNGYFLASYIWILGMIGGYARSQAAQPIPAAEPATSRPAG